MPYHPYELLVQGKSISLDQLAQAFPAMFGGQSPERATTAESAYGLVPWIFRAISISANAMVSVPYLVYRGTSDSPIDWPFEKTSQEWFHWRSDAAQNMWGAAFWQIRWQEKELRWLNPTTMEVNTDPKKGIVGFTQKLGGVPVGRWSPEQILYLPRFHPTSDFGPGIAPVDVALRDTNLAYNITEYASQFFAHGAIPAVLLKSDAPLRVQEQERIRSQWQKLYGSIKNAWRTAVLGRGIEPVVIGHAVKDLAMPELNEQATKNIAAAFEMSVTFLRGEAANFATAEQETVKYYIGTVTPKCLLRQSQMNLQLWRQRGYRGAYRLKDVEPIQQYEAAKAQGFARLMERVEASHEVGILSRKRAVYLIEELWGQMGFEKVKDIPDEEPEPEPAPVVVQAPPNGGPPQQQPPPPQGTPPQPAQRALPDPGSVISELRSWRRYVKNRGLEKALDRTFETRHIPDETAEKITDLLHSSPDILGALRLFDSMISHLEGKAPDPLIALEAPEEEEERPGEIDVDALLAPALRAWDMAMPDAQGILDAEPV